MSESSFEGVLGIFSGALSARAFSGILLRTRAYSSILVRRLGRYSGVLRRTRLYSVVLVCTRVYSCALGVQSPIAAAMESVSMSLSDFMELTKILP